MLVYRFINNPVPSNCYVLSTKCLGGECIVVDPGCIDCDELINHLTVNRLVPQFIILTHEHFDHAYGVNKLVELYRIPIICSELCSENIKEEWLNCSAQYDERTKFVIHSETISVESLSFTLHFSGEIIQFYLTPGHTDASICFTVGMFLFTGDTLLNGLQTVTKLPTGDTDKLKDSISILKQLKGQGLTVCPGHGVFFELDEYELNRALR